MSILFKKIEALFPPRGSFQPGDGLWTYSYRLPEAFDPDTISHGSQAIEFRAQAEKESGENVSGLEVEFRLSAKNFLFLLDEMDKIARDLGGNIKGLSCFVYKSWPDGEKPFWLRDLASRSEYMVWGVELNQDELDTDRISGKVARGVEFFSGILEVAFTVAEPEIIAAVTAPQSKEATRDKKSVMLVDDNEATLNLLQVILRTEFVEEELDFIPCSSGMQAFERALENKPDLILLDLMMPEKGGFEVLEELKNNPETKDIPVVILSVIYDEESVSKAERFGVDRYLVKPFVPYDITRVIREIVFKESLEV